MVNAFYQNSSYNRIAHSLFGMARLYASPNAFNPLLWAGIVALIVRCRTGAGFEKGVEYTRLRKLILFAIPINVVLLYLFPLGRALLPYMPIYVILALYGVSNIRWTGIRVAAVGSVCVVSILSVLLLPDANNRPFLYEKAATMVASKEGGNPIVIATRDPKVSYYLPGAKVVPITEAMIAQSDMVIVSNLTHNSLNPDTGGSLERQILRDNEIEDNASFSICARTAAGDYFVKVFCRQPQQ
jgi:hypothetical protein